MTADRDERLFAVLLRLAGLRGAEEGADLVLETLLGPGLRLLRADGGAVVLVERGELVVRGAAGPRSRAVEETGLRDGGATRQAHERRCEVTLGAEDPGSWPPRYLCEAGRHRIRTIHAVPMEAAGQALGVYTVHWRQGSGPCDDDEFYARTMARMAAVALVNSRRLEEQARRAGQLQHALNSRVVIEQAKGAVAARAGIDPASAFERLRAASRATGRPLTEVAADVLRARSPQSLRTNREPRPDPDSAPPARAHRHRPPA